MEGGTNIMNRFFSAVSVGLILGLGVNSYLMALQVPSKIVEPEVTPTENIDYGPTEAIAVAAPRLVQGAFLAEDAVGCPSILMLAQQEEITARYHEELLLDQCNRLNGGSIVQVLRDDGESALIRYRSVLIIYIRAKHLEWGETS